MSGKPQASSNRRHEKDTIKMYKQLRKGEIMQTEKTKTVSNPGFDDKQFTKKKYVDRWVNWAQDFGKLCDRDWDEFVKFQARVKELAEKQFDR